MHVTPQTLISTAALEASPLSVFLRTISAGCLVASGVLTWLQIPGYRQAAAVYPPGEQIAGIAVGNLTRDQAGDRIRQAYNLPVEIHYAGGVFQASPETLGFTIDTDSMLNSAGQGLSLQFWDYLWNRSPAPEKIPLQSLQNPDRIKAYLQQEIMPRYDRASVPAAPVPGGLDFNPGQNGTELEINSAVPRIEAALTSLKNRTATLDSLPVAPPQPSFQNLQIMLQQVLITSGYQSLAEIYLADLKTGQHIDFAMRQGQLVSPGIAFTAASTIKIPVMISVLRRVPDPIPQDVLTLVQEMIEASDNPSTDKVVQVAIDPVRGPLDVTADMQALGLKSTFWAGYFYDGAALLQSFSTPANKRQDVSAQPDQYNQTTAAEMGSLLEMIYQCAQQGTGKLVETFPGQISQAKCRQMIQLLEGNKLPVLIKSGVPDITPVGHKHGWVTAPDGSLHDISDAALVFSAGGDYAMTVYLYQPGLFDPANIMVAHLSEAVYNYFNLPALNSP